MSSEERKFQKRVAPLGVPDDLPEVALADEPGPSPEMVARMRARVLEQAAGVRRPAGRAWYRWAAAAAAVALVAVVAAGPSRVMAKMAGLLSFVPGFGMQQADSFLLYSPSPVQVAYKGGTVEVPGLMATGDGVTLRLIMRGYETWGPTGKPRLEDESGRSLGDASASGVARPGYWEQWLTFRGGVDEKTQALNLVLQDGDAELRIPVPLVLADGENPLAKFGPSVQAHGLSVAAQVHARSDTTEVSLLLQGEAPLAEGLGRPTPWALKGRLSGDGWETVITQESAGLGQMRTLSAESLPAGVDLARLAVDQLIVAEEGSATLTIPTSAGPVNQKVRLGRWDLGVTHTERSGDVLRVYLDLGPEGPESLHGIWEISLAGEPSSVAFGAGAEGERMAWFELKLLRESESVTLQFKHPEVRVEGPWVIDVPVRR